MSLRSIVSFGFWNVAAFVCCGFFLMDHPHRWRLLAILLALQLLLNAAVFVVRSRYEISGLTILLTVALFGVAAKTIIDAVIWNVFYLSVPFILLIWSLRADRVNASRKMKYRP